MLAKTGFALIPALICTLGLFVLMQALIRVDDIVLTPQKLERLVNFVRVIEPPVVKPKPPRTAPPLEPEVPPRTPPVALTQGTEGGGWAIDGPGPIETPSHAEGQLSFNDGAQLPITRVEPIYPRRAMSQGLHGWVIVEFTVTRNGAVRDPYVIGNCAEVSRGPDDAACADHPSSVFDKASIDAALKFRYKPRTVDGAAVETPGVRNLFTFELKEG